MLKLLLSNSKIHLETIFPYSHVVFPLYCNLLTLSTQHLFCFLIFYFTFHLFLFNNATKSLTNTPSPPSIDTKIATMFINLHSQQSQASNQQQHERRLTQRLSLIKASHRQSLHVCYEIKSF